MSPSGTELPPERPGHAAPADLAERRGQLAAAVAAGIWRTDPPAREIVLGGRRVLRFDPPRTPRGIVLHFHGGAFRIGAPDAVAPFAAALAEKCGVAVLCPAYRLAPEHPFPAAVNDGIAVIAALAEADTLPLIVSGDSAGGGLAASLTAHAVEHRQPIAGLILLSAWLDLTVSSASYERNAGTDPLFSRASASEAAELYLQGASAEHPMASPLLVPVAGFPRALISVGSGEVLVEDSRRFRAKLCAAGIDARLAEIAEMEHVAVTRGLRLPGSAETFAAIAGFIEDVLARDP